MRFGGLIGVAVAVLLVSPVLAVSTRPVHNALVSNQVTASGPFMPAATAYPAIACGTPGYACTAASISGTQLYANEDGTMLWNTGGPAPSFIAGSPPIYQCGVPDADLTLRIENPIALHVAPTADPTTQGIWRADGSFFLLPQLSGPLAANARAIWFGFLETLPGAGVANPETICAESAAAGLGVPGGYYEFYRGDTDPSDGWMIPINTLLVPDNVYGATLRVWGTPAAPGLGGLVPLKTIFVYAIVDNRALDENTRSCTPTLVSCGHRDITPPWPMVNVDSSGPTKKLIVEFGEYVMTAGLGGLGIFIDGSPKSFTTCALNVPPNPAPPCEPRSFDVDPLLLLPVQTDKWGTRAEVSLAGVSTGTHTVRITATDRECGVGPAAGGTCAQAGAAVLGNTATKVITITV